MNLAAVGLSMVLRLGPAVPDAPAPALTPSSDETSAGRVVVLPFGVEGTLADSWRAELRQAVDDGLADGRFEVVEASAPDGCREPSCLTPQAESAEIQGVVRPWIRVEERDYAVVIELLDPQGQVVATSEESCPVCGMAEVVALVRGQAAALRGRLDVQALAPPMLELNTQPSGAAVRIDGETIGTTPVRRELSPGSHRLEITRAGYLPDVRTIEVTPGVHQPLDVVLLPDDAPRRRRRIAGITMTGVGLGGVVAGSVLWGLDSRPAPGERCQGVNVDAVGRCRYLYDTRVLGISLTTAAVAVLATGVALWISGRRRGGQAPERSALRWGGPRLVRR